MKLRGAVFDGRGEAILSWRSLLSSPTSVLLYFRFPFGLSFSVLDPFSIAFTASFFTPLISFLRDFSRSLFFASAISNNFCLLFPKFCGVAAMRRGVVWMS
jgi:hypothetical protein